MSIFMQRVLSGAVYVGVVIASLVWYSAAPVFPLLVALLVMMAVREFHVLAGDDKWLTVCGIVLSAGMTAFWYMMAIGLPLRLFFVAWSTIFALVMLAELFRKAPDPLANWGHLLAGQFMVALPFALMTFLAEYDSRIMLALFVIIWLNDSGAYCVGNLTAKLPNGNHKMFPRVSPHKSWEGLIGGILCALGTGALCSLFVDAYPLWQWILIALCVAVAGTFGDLMESLLKRTVGVKDSGCFMPGHGGVLDRFDSLLLATPVVFLLLVLL